MTKVDDSYVCIEINETEGKREKEKRAKINNACKRKSNAEKKRKEKTTTKNI